ncbi:MULTISPECIES: exopolysaccharide transport family protein [Ensifer]|jgi:exopolysaccharide transport family protein|uniref:AAA family ATPase n=1 Tax=Ensifer canadensis TaxID=555315 RepID=A0AAW4FFZ0_9HYPH|nr:MULTISPECIES: exopolysaccharide transport family protein [Ensifer]MDP9629661.1 exopolysaccharide transport family protein [Ensifer adhaerens]KQU71966.1 chain-length determining protein [Ensifer sp. Root31]KQW44153.1 chain-length determining protein [Ensifer sp. Root1252]KQY61231.1 chain-length determining protein [Ensifer sp. Root142]KRC57867.1 chain-length determining protein [Ensifer sp. Root231]
MSGNGSGQQDVDIDLGGLFRAVWDRRVKVLLATACVAALAFGAAKMIAPDYQSETRVLIESREPEFSGSNQNAQTGSDRVFDESGILSQVQVLRSADLIKQVARNMKLHEQKEFDPSAAPSAVSDLMVMLGLKKNPLEMPPEERVLKEFTSKLQVYQVEKSRVIAIAFTSKDRQLAAAIPNEMAKVFLSLQSGAKLDTNSEASRWLEPEIANLREKVRDAEAKVAAYRSSSDLLPTGETTNFATRQLTDISTELTRVRGERANAEARAEGVRAALASGREADTIADVVGSPMIQRLKETEANLQGQVADLSTTLLDGHPRLKALKSQVEGIRAQIRSETRKILSSLENEAKVGELREQQLTQQLNALKAKSAQAGEEEVGLRALEREATAQRQLLETYLARYREATSRTVENATPADARVISSAVVPTGASFPKVMPITIVAALATFLLSCIIIMLGELFSGRALRPVSVGAERPPARSRPAIAAVAAADGFDEKKLNISPALNDAIDLPPLAPLAEDETDDVVDDPSGETAEPDFSIEAVADHLRENAVRIAISVSPGGDEGSTATVMLARLIAEEDRKVVLIDLTGSACPTRLMARSAQLPGITNLLAGEVAFTETIHADRFSDAHIIPQGDADPRLAMRGIERLQMIIDALTNAYDLVLVECGPADEGAVDKIARRDGAEIILSAPAVSEERIIEVLTGFGEAGYRDIVLMTGRGEPGPDYPDRHAA